VTPTETPAAGKVPPSKPATGQAQAGAKQRQRVVALVLVVGLVLAGMLILLGGWLPGQRPANPPAFATTAGPGSGYVSPTFDITKALASIYPTQTAYATSAVTVTPWLTLTPSGGSNSSGQAFRICVHEAMPGDTLDQIFQQDTQQFETYYFENQDCYELNGDLQCRNRKVIQNAEQILVGWWIVLNKISQGTCSAANGVWGQWLTP